MSVNEKIMNIIALAMSIKATNRYFLVIDWDSYYPNHVDIFLHVHENGKSKAVVEHHTYGGDDGNFLYDSYESMIAWLNSLKREWGQEMIKCQNN